MRRPRLRSKPQGSSAVVASPLLRRQGNNDGFMATEAISSSESVGVDSGSVPQLSQSTLPQHGRAVMNETSDANNIIPEQASDNVASQSVGGDSGAPNHSSDSAVFSSAAEFLAVIRDITDKMVISTEKFCDAINNVNLSTKREQLMEALRGIESLTLAMRIKAHKTIGSNLHSLELFFMLRPDERESWILSALSEQ